MTKIYKFTDKEGFTSYNTNWLPLGTTHTVEWGGALCAQGCLHAYSSPFIAVLMDSIHGFYLVRKGRLFEGEGDVRLSDGAKLGCSSITLHREIEIPVLSFDASVCVMQEVVKAYPTPALEQRVKQVEAWAAGECAGGLVAVQAVAEIVMTVARTAKACGQDFDLNEIIQRALEV